jgi:hypothetical protein
VSTNPYANARVQKCPCGSGRKGVRSWSVEANAWVHRCQVCRTVRPDRDPADRARRIGTEQDDRNAAARRRLEDLRDERELQRGVDPW